MPAPLVKSFASKTGKSVDEVERLWDKAKSRAAEQGHEEEYDYIVGILKNMLKLERSERTSRQQIEEAIDRLLEQANS